MEETINHSQGVMARPTHSGSGAASQLYTRYDDPHKPVKQSILGPTTQKWEMMFQVLPGLIQGLTELPPRVYHTEHNS